MANLQLKELSFNPNYFKRTQEIALIINTVIDNIDLTKKIIIEFKNIEFNLSKSIYIERYANFPYSIYDSYNRRGKKYIINSKTRDLIMTYLEEPFNGTSSKVSWNNYDHLSAFLTIYYKYINSKKTNGYINYPELPEDVYEIGLNRYKLNLSIKLINDCRFLREESDLSLKEALYILNNNYLYLDEVNLYSIILEFKKPVGERINYID